MEIRLSALLILLMSFAVGCSEDGVTESPIISNLSIDPMTVEEFTDTVTISFEYADINGDLGFSDPNIPSIFIKDSRLEHADEFHLQPLTPNEDELNIDGSISVRLNNLFILGNDSAESLLISVTIMDRAGNTSNELISDSVLVVRP